MTTIEPDPLFAFMTASRAPATCRAWDQDEVSRSPPEDLTEGAVRRLSELTGSYPYLPLSQSQLWLTGSQSIPSRRVTRLADDWTAARQPTAQVVQVDST